MIDQGVVFDRILEAFMTDYAGVYYVDTNTNAFGWYEVDHDNGCLQLKQEGDDFFAGMEAWVPGKEHDDGERSNEVVSVKEQFLKRLCEDSMQSFVYRLKLEERLVFHTLRLIRSFAEEDAFLIFGVLNTNITEQNLLKRERIREAYQAANQIAETLADRYDLIYYVELKSGKYTVQKNTEIYGTQKLAINAKDFFANAKRVIEMIVHPEDKAKVGRLLDQNRLLSSLREGEQDQVECLTILQGKLQHTRVSVSLASDNIHVVVVIENINQEIEKEREQLLEINAANEKAYTDILTGVKNKNAYQELREKLQQKINQNIDCQFGMVVCDLNNLKKINDTLGHTAGDEYIQATCCLLSKIYEHSTVYRIGGDEFLVFLEKQDYRDRDQLLEAFRKSILDNQSKGEGPVAAVGMSVYQSGTDRKISDVFDRADGEMYIDKRKLKAGEERLNADDEMQDEIHKIPAIRKSRLDAIFNAFRVVAGDGHIFLCDMRYDYYRWDRQVVQRFGLPAEYMYNASKIWEKKIHADDEDFFHKRIEEVFNGGKDEFELSYRLKSVDGVTPFCTCRGIVIRDSHGHSEYFGGVLTFS